MYLIILETKTKWKTVRARSYDEKKKEQTEWYETSVLTWGSTPIEKILFIHHVSHRSDTCCMNYIFATTRILRARSLCRTSSPRSDIPVFLRSPRKDGDQNHQRPGTSRRPMGTISSWDCRERQEPKSCTSSGMLGDSAMHDDM